MPPAARFLQTNSRNYPTAEPPGPLAADSDVVVVLAALLCALVCVAGLALVARCAWLRRTIASARAPPAAPANKGLKKKALQALPKLPYAPGAAGGSLSSECAICLAEFDEGDEVRVLPQCGHGFHVGCVDAWLGSNSSCPSCRRVLVVVPAPPAPARCHLCGANSDGPAAAATEAAAGSKSRDDDDANKTLP